MARVVVPSILSAQAGGQRHFHVDVDTVGEALRAMPFSDLVLNERGELRRYVNVYVDGVDAREHGDLACPLRGAKEVRIVAMLSGG
jgi:molybdopterin converting factor small subunit